MKNPEISEIKKERREKMKRLTVASIVLVMVLFMADCAIASPVEKDTSPRTGVEIEISDIMIGYTSLITNEELAGVTLKDATISDDFPPGTTTAVCFVVLTCPKGTLIRAVWWINGKVFRPFEMEAFEDLTKVAIPFWCRQSRGLSSGHWRVEVSLSEKEPKSIEFTVQ